MNIIDRMILLNAEFKELSAGKGLVGFGNGIHVNAEFYAERFRDNEQLKAEWCGHYIRRSCHVNGVLFFALFDPPSISTLKSIPRLSGVPTFRRKWRIGDER